MARVMRHNQRYQKNFSLADFGDWESAEKAGAVWIRKKIKELPPEIPREGRMTIRNSSGVVGVFISDHVIRRPSGKEYVYPRWTARWPKCEFSGGVTWYVHQFGHEDAFVLAVLARQLRTVDRATILARFDEIDGGAEYQAIVSQLKQ